LVEIEAHPVAGGQFRSLVPRLLHATAHRSAKNKMKITLTKDEWDVLQDEVSLYTDLVPDLGEKKEGEIEFEMDAEDLEELIGYVAATANHAESKKIERKLDGVFLRMETALKKQT
jgi:hypothetical protein